MRVLGDGEYELTVDVRELRAEYGDCGSHRVRVTLVMGSTWELERELEGLRVAIADAAVEREDKNVAEEDVAAERAWTRDVASTFLQEVPAAEVQADILRRGLPQSLGARTASRTYTYWPCSELSACPMAFNTEAERDAHRLECGTWRTWAPGARREADADADSLLTAEELERVADARARAMRPVPSGDGLG